MEFVAGVRNPETYYGIECALRAFDYDDTSMMQEAFLFKLIALLSVLVLAEYLAQIEGA